MVQHWGLSNQTLLLLHHGEGEPVQHIPLPHGFLFTIILKRPWLPWAMAGTHQSKDATEREESQQSNNQLME